MVSFEDARMSKLADVLGNKTCKKIIDFLAEKEASKTDISRELKIPLNTVEYNINKLVEAGLIEKAKTFFWSTKGKKIMTYKVSNKSIVISPKTSNKVKSIVAVVAASGILAFLIKTFSPQPQVTEKMVQEAREFGENITAGAQVSQNIMTSLALEPWLWFLFGALIVLIIFLILNWKKL